jgi:glucokinase
MKNQSIIGVDVGGTKICFGKVKNGILINHHEIPTKADRGSQDIINDIILGIETLIDSSTFGIGVGAPGLVDEERGVVYDVQNIPSWKEVHLSSVLENYFNRIVQVSNDANCFVMGEKIFGKGRDYRNLVGITLGTGVGGGIVIDNKLYPGTLMAGEFCGISYKDSSFDFYCGSKFFSEKHSMTGFEISQKALDGDLKSIEIYNEYGKNLSDLFKIIMLVLNPEAIILGGSISKSYALFESSLKYHLSQFSLNRVVRNTKIEVSETENIAVIGAAALVYNHKKWIEVIK